MLQGFGDDTVDINDGGTVELNPVDDQIQYLKKALSKKSFKNRIEIVQKWWNNTFDVFVSMDTKPAGESPASELSEEARLKGMITSESSGYIHTVENTMAALAKQPFYGPTIEYKEQGAHVVAKLTFDAAKYDMRQLEKKGYLTLDEDDQQKEIRRNVRGLLVSEMPLPSLDYRSRMGECRVATRAEAETRKQHYETQLAQNLQNPGCLEISVRDMTAKQGHFWVEVACKEVPQFKRKMANIPINAEKRESAAIQRW